MLEETQAGIIGRYFGDCIRAFIPFCRSGESGEENNTKKRGGESPVPLVDVPRLEHIPQTELHLVCPRTNTVCRIICGMLFRIAVLHKAVPEVKGQVFRQFVCCTGTDLPCKGPVVKFHIIAVINNTSLGVGPTEPGPDIRHQPCACFKRESPIKPKETGAYVSGHVRKRIQRISHIKIPTKTVGI